VDGGHAQRRWPVRALGAAVALVVTAPLLAPGFVLVGDMVFVPRQHLTPDAVGLGSALPRAVPGDAVVAVLTTVVPGDLLQKAVLLAVVAAAVIGAARLVPVGAGPGAWCAPAVAGLAYGWNPYLAERLLMGHWSLLAGYAALPWVARAALALRGGAGRTVPLARLVLAMAPAALTPTGSLLAGGVAVALSGRRGSPWSVGATLVLALPWLVAGLAHPGSAVSAADGVAAFAARGESLGDSAAGAVVAVLGGGGIWNAGAVPASRASLLAPLVTGLVVALACAGWPRLVAAWGRPAWALAGLGAAGAVLACAGALPGAADLLRVAVEQVPGAGLLRDGQKWAAWWVLAVAVGAGAGAARLAAAARAVRVPVAAVAAGALVLPVIAVPDLAWGVGGRLGPVAYPAEWDRVAAVLAADPAPGDVLALPFGAIRSFGWNAGRPQLDPAPRYLPRPVVVDDTLVVGSVVGSVGAASGVARTVTGWPTAEPVRPCGWWWGRTAGPPRPERRWLRTRPRWPRSASAGCSSSAAPPGRPFLRRSRRSRRSWPVTGWSSGGSPGPWRHRRPTPPGPSR
jgi:hypothetical protein